MIQVSMGRRSRSPFSPLSLRMMSRADLMMLPSCWAVVGRFGLRSVLLAGRPCASDARVLEPMRYLCGVQQASASWSTASRSCCGAAEQPGDLDHIAVPRDAAAP